MNLKPTAAIPVRVYKVRHVWGGMFTVTWSDLLNYPRNLSELFRKVDGKWQSGEGHPTGCKSGPLREAPGAVALALDAA